MADFRIGTCSWKYGSWKGLVYSADKGINFLEEYARRFRTVEIDQWFWSLHGPGKITLPRANVVREYLSSVPEDFLFTIKAPNALTLTHHRDASATPNTHFLDIQLFEDFLATIAPLRERCASIMLQFEYLNKQKMPDRALFFDKLEELLSRVPPDVPVGVETRNPNYLGREYFAILERSGAHHVFLEGYYMPSIVELYRKHGYSGQRTVLRLHGPDRKGMEEQSGGMWNARIEQRDEALRDIAWMVVDLIGKDVDVFANVNNHYEGSAPLTIERFLVLLREVAQEAGVPLPD
ncbi:MAG TPA: DUF72 domain-containing protein [Bacteroidota bacterium]|nr:DUF72 domain-containing protein [Bacteroidota bacterium]